MKPNQPPIDFLRMHAEIDQIEGELPEDYRARVVFDLLGKKQYAKARTVMLGQTISTEFDTVFFQSSDTLDGYSQDKIKMECIHTEERCRKALEAWRIRERKRLRRLFCRRRLKRLFLCQ